MYSDLNFYFQIYGDKEMMQYIADSINFSQAEKRVIATIKTMSSEKPEHLTYIVLDQITGDKIGIIGLTIQYGVNKTNAEIGVMIIKPYRRKNKANEAKKMLLSAGFNDFGLSAIYAICDFRNIAANAANKKLGFKKLETFVEPRKKTKHQRWVMNNNKK